MKNFIFFLISLFVAVAVAALLHHWLVVQNDPGYVLVGMGHWSLETSLTVFVVVEVIGFFVLYSFFRLLGVLVRMPEKISKRRRNIKFNRSQEALISGLFDAADGNWESAENILIKHAPNSGAPLLHYLTAARAAQSRGALDKRDEYLKKAVEQSSDTNITVGLTMAELHLSEQQFGQALETLEKLHSINPGHSRVLKMLHQAYQHLGDWDGLSRLLPSLQKNKILVEAEVRLLQTETFSSLLKQAAEKQDQQALQECWDNMPGTIRDLPGIANIYFAAMISLGAGVQIEQMVVQQLAKHWDDTSLVLFSCIEFGDTARHLQEAEKWLIVYPRDAVLLRVLGKLALKDGQMEKAEQYLLKSLQIDPSVDACQYLAEVMMANGEKDKACEYFKQALAMLTGEVLHHAESISV